VTAKLKTMGELFMGRRPEREIIVPCVRWRLRNKLSLRDRVEKKATGDPSGPQACEIVRALAVRLYLPETGRVDREAISLNRVFAGVTVRAAPAAGGYSVVCSAKGLAPEFLS